MAQHVEARLPAVRRRPRPCPVWNSRTRSRHRTRHSGNHLKGRADGCPGAASGREFDPEAAGGPIQQLDAGTAAIASEGVAEVAAHLRRVTGGGSPEGPERAI